MTLEKFYAWMLEKHKIAKEDFDKKDHYEKNLYFIEYRTELRS